MNPLVSIIIPCFNAEKYLREAIESALAQTYQPVEVMVIDDGSTDGSAEVARSFAGRIRLESQSHRGAPAARNRGLGLARGDFIQFLDADDLLDPGKLTHQMPCMMERSEGLVFCDGRALWPGSKDQIYDAPLREGDDPVAYVLRNSLPTISPVYRKNELTAVRGFREDLPCAQEFDLHLRMACRGIPFIHLPGFFYTQRKVEGGLSRDYGRVLAQFENIIPPAFEFLRRDGGMTISRRQAFAEAMCVSATRLFELGDDDLAKRYYAIAAAMDSGRGFTAYRPAVRLLSRVLGPLPVQKIVRMARRFRRWTGFNARRLDYGSG